MLNWLKTRTEDRCKARELYGAVVTAARQPAFYSGCGVEDTPEGRYEMIAVHLYLVLERLHGAGSEADRIAQRVVETFVTDMDDSMREMGVGDLSVGKKVKRSAAGLYQRFSAYRAATAQSSESLADRLREFVPGVAGHPRGAPAIAAYMAASSARLAAQDLTELFGGTASFPNEI